MNEIQKLGLDSRSLLYSYVELCGGGYACEFYVGGIPDQYSIESTDGYRDFVDGLENPMEIDVEVTAYSVGRGESVPADEQELKILLAHGDAIDKQYGIDTIQSDSFTRQFEPEEEQ